MQVLELKSVNTYQEAKELFKSGIVVYITLGDLDPNTDHNTFMLCNFCFDASLNMYLNGRKPIEIPFGEYISYITQGFMDNVRFYTYNSTELLYVNF